MIKKSISIVVPLYNEYESVQPLYQKIFDVVQKEQIETYEVVFVDDGSSDNTYHECDRLSLEDSNVKVIKLRSNSGQTSALHAGLQYASGEIIITMDGDLQNDPEDIPKFVEKLEEGFDIVLGWRHNRHDKLISRKIPSKIANWLISKLTKVKIKDNGCAIRAYKGSIVKKFPMYSEMHRLMPVMTALAGARFTQIKVNHHSRQFGHSKYGLSRIYKVFLDMFSLKFVLSFYKMPLYGFGILAVIMTMFGFLTFLFTSYEIYAYGFETFIISIGVLLLTVELSLFLLFMGIIAIIGYSLGDTKIDKLIGIKV